MSTMRVRSSTSIRLTITTDSPGACRTDLKVGRYFSYGRTLPVYDFEIQRLRLSFGDGEACRATLNLLEKLWIGALSVLDIIDGDREVSIVGRQRFDPELSLLVGSRGLHKP